MIEDKLTVDQRIRVEALDRALKLYSNVGGERTAKVVKSADEFEKYIRNGKIEGST